MWNTERRTLSSHKQSSGQGYLEKVALALSVYMMYVFCLTGSVIKRSGWWKRSHKTLEFNPHLASRR